MEPLLIAYSASQLGTFLRGEVGGGWREADSLHTDGDRPNYLHRDF